MKTIHVFLLVILTVLFISCNGSSSDPSNERIKEVVTDFINEDTAYTCPAKNFNKAFKRNVGLVNFQGVFKNSENEYQAKVIIGYDNCWKKKKEETMNFFFLKDTQDKWILSKITFDSATQFQVAPTAIYGWYDKIKSRKITL